MSVPRKWHIDTQAIHSGDQERFAGAAVTPIFQSSTFVFDGDTSRGYDAVKYARCSNTPNHNVSKSNEWLYPPLAGVVATPCSCM